MEFLHRFQGRSRIHDILTKGDRMLSLLVKLQARAAAMRDDRGATAVEYGLMVALIAIAIIGAVTLVSGQVSGLFSDTATSN
jgi:pilus assembly protein Flp/PilA